MDALPVATAAAPAPPRRFAHAHHRQHQRPDQRQPVDQNKVHASYRTLGVNVGSDWKHIRQRYLELAKQLHPDAQSTDADSTESAAPPSSAAFQRVQEAYTFLSGLHADVLRDARARAIAHGLATEADFEAGGSRRDAADAAAAAASAMADAPPPSSSQPVPNAAAGHTVVQNRGYLRNEGVGTGSSPMARDAQYRSHRLSRGVDAALDYKMARMVDAGDDASSTGSSSPLTDAAASAKELAAFDSLLSITRASANTKHISSATLVEEQIKDAVSRWDLRELPDFGRPLSHLAHDSGVVADPLEAKLHKILLREGVLPDWVQLEREIDAQSSAILAELSYVWNGLVTAQQFREGTKLRQREKTQAYKQNDDADKNQSTLTPATPTATAATSDVAPTVASAASASATAADAETAAALGLSSAAPFGLAWSLAQREYLSALVDLNSKIDAFNLSVPLRSRQRVHQSAVGVVEAIEAMEPNAALLEDGTARVRERDTAAFARRRSSAKATDGGAAAAADAKRRKQKKQQLSQAAASSSAGASASASASAAASSGSGFAVSSALEDARPLDLLSSGSISSTLFSAPATATLASASSAAAAVASARASLSHSLVSGSDAPLDLDALDLDTSTLTEQEIESLYRALALPSAAAHSRSSASGRNHMSAEEAAAERRRQAATQISPLMVATLIASAVGVLALPVWLVRTSRRATADAAVAVGSTAAAEAEDDG